MYYMEVETVPTKYLSKDMVDFLHENNEEGNFVYVIYDNDGQPSIKKKIYEFGEVLDKVKPDESIILLKHPPKVKGFEVGKSWTGDYSLKKVSVVDLLEKIEEHESEIWGLQITIVENILSNLLENFESEKKNLKPLMSDMITYRTEDDIVFNFIFNFQLLTVLLPNDRTMEYNRKHVLTNKVFQKLEKEYKQ